MTRRSREDHFARVRELYTFDENLGSDLVSCMETSGTPLLETVRSRKKQDLTPTLAGFDEAGRGALAGPVAVGCVHFLFLTSGSIPHPVASKLAADVFLTAEATPLSDSASERSNHSPAQSPDHPIAQSLNHSILQSLAGVDDSKRLSPARREATFRRITEVASWGVGWASAQEIDRLGIVPAISLAARRAYTAMGQRVNLLLCDRGLSLLSDLAIERLNHSQPRTPNHPISQSPLRAKGPSGPAADHSIIQSLELSFTKGDSRSFHIAAASILAKVSRDRMMLNLHQRFPVYGFAANKGYGTPAHLAALRDNGPSAIHRRSFRVKE